MSYAHLLLDLRSDLGGLDELRGGLRDGLRGELELALRRRRRVRLRLRCGHETRRSTRDT
jgi:hypothetical protein